ncbi:YnhF family membrane protein [Vibrio plantisponsor]|jgi:hypothetical protein|uniref:Uncharacterized protein n=1 Tax=Vibrio diazotrophicus TaxID=685 RepID=A0A2J8GSZ5_VIBDI|nr:MULTISPECIES: YnhF family membrane protein [Vibrio]MBD0785164.1 YnhF family membrane protein [Vibrio sp. Y2-5]NIY92714.1 YnhF family membrane protein [Vibrio diazotrophicus]PNH89154.1 YnhF family membrane protein [Vibrio diazotrophicus]RAS63598.1 hypothetical protein DET48_111149 [Vibrio diazotrophicus]
MEHDLKFAVLATAVIFTVLVGFGLIAITH